MEDSEKDKRVSNLKNILGNVKKDSGKKENDDIEGKNIFSETADKFDELLEKSSNNNLIENFEEDIIIEDEIDDEFIYTPSKKFDGEILEETSEIDEAFIISTTDDDDFPELDFAKDEKGDISSIKNTFKDDIDLLEDDDFLDDESSDIPGVDQVSNFFTYKIGTIQISYIIGILLGVFLLSMSVLRFFGGSERIFDNVVSGENSVIGIIFLFLGVIILVYSIYKAFSLKNPFGDLALSIDNLEKSPRKKKEKEDETPEILKEPPIDREKYKIGEFDLKTLKETNKPEVKTELEIEPATIVEEKDEEIIFDEEKDPLESKSIDDIFSELEQVETIEETIPIISLDDKIEKDSSKKEE